MPDQERHEPGSEVPSDGDYVPVDDSGTRTAGPVPLEEGDEFPPLQTSDEAWMAVEVEAEDD
jgi:hypothetical protein